MDKETVAYNFIKVSIGVISYMYFIIAVVFGNIFAILFSYLISNEVTIRIIGWTFVFIFFYVLALIIERVFSIHSEEDKNKVNNKLLLRMIVATLTFSFFHIVSFINELVSTHIGNGMIIEIFFLFMLFYLFGDLIYTVIHKSIK